MVIINIIPIGKVFQRSMIFIIPLYFASILPRYTIYISFYTPILWQYFHYYTLSFFLSHFVPSTATIAARRGLTGATLPEDTSGRSYPSIPFLGQQGRGLELPVAWTVVSLFERPLCVCRYAYPFSLTRLWFTCLYWFNDACDAKTWLLWRLTWWSRLNVWLFWWIFVYGVL